MVFLYLWPTWHLVGSVYSVVLCTECVLSVFFCSALGLFHWKTNCNLTDSLSHFSITSIRYWEMPKSASGTQITVRRLQFTLGQSTEHCSAKVTKRERAGREESASERWANLGEQLWVKASYCPSRHSDTLCSHLHSAFASIATPASSGLQKQTVIKASASTTHRNN